MKSVTAPKQPHRQNGFVLPFALVLLVVLIMLSAGFFNRSADSAVFSGTTRDSGQAMLLAESTLNRLIGQFSNGRDVDGQNGADASDAKALMTALASPPSPINVKYIFYRTGGAGIDQNGPDILQRVANGEARNSGSALASQAVSNGTGRLKINNLFVSNVMSPLLFVHGSNGLGASAAASWDAETAAEKVAVWIEVTRNPLHTGWLDVYVQSAAQVGGAKAYVQRFIGSYKDTLGNWVPPMGEAANSG